MFDLEMESVCSVIQRRQFSGNNRPFHRDRQSSENRTTNQEPASFITPFVITVIGSSDLLYFTLLKSSLVALR